MAKQEREKGRCEKDEAVFSDAGGDKEAVLDVSVGGAAAAEVMVLEGELRRARAGRQRLRQDRWAKIDARKNDAARKTGGRRGEEGGRWWWWKWRRRRRGGVLVKQQ